MKSVKTRLQDRLLEFIAHAQRPNWHELRNPLASEIGLFFDEPPFAVKSCEERPDSASIHLEWSGAGDTLSALYGDFFRRFARCVETTNFVHREMQDDCLLVQIVAGDEMHGHFIEVRVTGAAVDRVRESLRRYLEVNTLRQNRA